LLTTPPGFGYLVVTLACFAVLGSAFLTGDAPWGPWLRALDRGWVAQAWARPVAGVWHFGFERSAFVPCPGLSGGLPVRAGDVWWASHEGRTFEEVRAQVWGQGRLMTDTTLFVVWFGDVSPRGEYGHLGGYTRQIAVSALGHLRPISVDACARALADPHLWAIE
jgi:hypothetical protein